MDQIILKRIDAVRPILAGRKVFLVKDQAFDFLPIRSFFDGYEGTSFSSFTPNPLYEEVREGVRCFLDSDCDVIVAVGGGSTIDVAKCIKLYCRMDQDANYLTQQTEDSRVPLIAIPTTAGTGSESTRHAVIYFEGKKQSISHPSIVPDVAVLEPSVLKSLPLYQKKCTMLDALCQGIESWWSVNSTEESREYSRIAVEGIYRYWREYIERNSDDASAHIMEAANAAGRAINITATTAPHAMSYKLTSLYRLPHGHAVAVSMPRVWRYMNGHTENCIDPRGEAYLRSVLADIPVSVEWFEELLVKLEIHDPVSENRPADIEVLTKSVNTVRLKNNPVRLPESVLRQMYEEIVK